MDDKNLDADFLHRPEAGVQREPRWRRIGRLDENVMRYVRKELEDGRLDELTDAGQRLQRLGAFLTLSVEPELRMDVSRATFSGEGIVDVTVPPDVKVDTFITPDVMKVIRAAVPDLANDIVANPKAAKDYLTFLTALLQLITALAAINQMTHQQTPSPAQITQFFDNSIHQTIVVDPPPPPDKAKVAIAPELGQAGIIAFQRVF